MPFDIKPKRVLIKISGEMFKGKNETGPFDYQFMIGIAQKVVSLVKKGLQVAIVSGGGNIFRGGDSNGVIETTTGHYMGMLATLMNGVALGDILEKNGVDVRVLSSIEAPRVVPTFNRNEALRQLTAGRVVIATAGTGNPYCTNDLAAVIRALELNCDLMIKATKVDGVYDKDPMKFPDAKKFEKISLYDAYELGLKIMDHSAIATAMDNNLPIFVCKLESLDRLLEPDVVGSYIHP